MKKLVVFFILLIAIPSILAQWYYDSQNIVVDIGISSYAEVVPTTPSGYIETATINMTFFPKQAFNQELLKFYTSPQAELDGDSLKFTWQKPEGKIDFRINANVRTANAVTKIRQKISFPIERLPSEVIAYTKPSETIDSDNEEIIRKASELAKGEDDLYAAVFKIADWTKNSIEYNLSTLTADVSQKASWVLQNRQGVCDELTSLFIALLRAVGVPARFVSGISYTESDLFPEKWGPHGWAEVYMPGYGWVPFDVTYGEFGWVDPTHIKFKESVDSDEPSTYYQWRSRNANLKTRKLDIKTELTEAAGYTRVPLGIEASILKKAVSFGSYNLITVDVENLNDFYYAAEIYLTKPKEVKVIGSEPKSILLLPKEKKKVFWILKVDGSLDSKYSYTFPLIARTLNNISSATSFAANVRERDVPSDEVEQIAELLEEEKEKKYSGNVVLECRTGKEEFYQDESVSVYCDARNTGNVFLDNVDVCFEGKCQKIDLGISQTKNVSFEADKSNAGRREGPVTLRNELVSKTAYVNFKISDIPKIQIESLSFPANVSYGENFTVFFTVSKISQSSPKNVEVVFAQNGIEKRWHINELLESRKFALSFEGNQLKNGRNDYKINVGYSDGLAREYNANKEFSILMIKATLLQKLHLSLNAVGSSFETIGYGTLAMMLLVGAIAYVAVIIILFRKGKGD